MRPKIFKLLSIVLLLLFTGAGCQKDELELSDENIEISSLPGISIYKTRNDYSDKLTVGLDSLGNVSSVPHFTSKSSVVKKNSKGDYVLVNRHFLKKGYIQEDIFFDDVFTDITINEMVETSEKFAPGYWSTDRYESRIIDRDPYTEFYYYKKKEGDPVFSITLGDINEMIENGTLENLFIRLK